MKPAGLKSLSPRAQIFLWAALAVLFACAALSLVFATHGGMREKLPQSSTNSELPPIPPPNLVQPLSPVEAQAKNAERPFVIRADVGAAPFVLKSDKTSSDRALECMAQAIYYEAGLEPNDGKRAVAQVILNRMRHPGYPATVCGVVYQGSSRATGCQFTFTCDGSLARPPAAQPWAVAREIAVAALKGFVFKKVGHATHYHADYVLPYWADSLDKQMQIGHHIFYRLRGSVGSVAAFSQRYSGPEPVPASPATTATALELANPDALAPEAELPPALVGNHQLLEADKEHSTVIQADQTHGTLMIAGGSDQKQQKKQTVESCPQRGTVVKTTAAKATELRAGMSVTTC